MKKIINKTVYFEIIFFLLIINSVIPSQNASKQLNQEKKEINESITPQKSNNQPYDSEKLSNYTLSVRLDEENCKVFGNLSVNYYNNDNINFSYIPFHIYPSGMQYIERQGNIDIIDVTSIPGDISLNFSVDSSDQIMQVDLLETLEPDRRTSFEIEFVTTMPDGGIDRCNVFGNDENQSKIYKFAVAYPMPCVHDEWDQWNTDPYLELGDPFYSDMAWYEFIVEVPKEMIVAATGQLINQEDFSTTTRYQFDPIFPVRELTFCSSKYFIVESETVKDVNVSSYYIPKSSDLWAGFALEIATNSISLYSEKIGKYPYPTYNVVEEYTHFGGMEHPLQIYATEAADNSYNPEWYLETIIAHETAHQWFYQLVGNDEIDCGHLDEGLVCWVTEYYKDTYHPNWNIFDPFWALEPVRSYNYNVESNISRKPNKINQSIYECEESGTDYWYIAYTKAPMIYEKLRLTIGDDGFFDSLELFFERYKFKNAWLSDLQECFENETNQDLNWFFLPWFDNLYLPDYSFTEMNYTKESNILELLVEDLNEDINPYKYSQEIPLYVFDRKGNEIYSKIYWINGSTSISISLTEEPYEIELRYLDDVLFQTKKEYEDEYPSLKLYVSEKKKIPGFSTFLLIPLIALGILISKKKRIRS